uniref:Uncharacterized protein n=1 Tax=Biomphalaria glabrata TaxID=6526 RepID=A0A2C9KG60_BIOGL
MDQFRYLDQWYFDYCVHISIQNAKEKNWRKINEIESKCMGILSGFLEISELNKLKAQFLIIIVFLKKISCLEQCDNEDNDTTEDDISIFDMLNQLISSLEDLCKHKEQGDSFKICLAKTLQYRLQTCKTHSSLLTAEERESIEAESLKTLNTMKIGRPKKKATVKPDSLIAMIVEAISNLYEKLETPLILTLLGCHLEIEKDEVWLKDVVAGNRPNLEKQINKEIIKCSGNPKVNLKKTLAAIKEKVLKNEEVKDALSIQLMKLKFHAALNKKKFFRSVSLREAAHSLRNAAVQTYSVITETNSAQTDLSHIALTDKSSLDGKNTPSLSHEAPSLKTRVKGRPEAASTSLHQESISTLAKAPPSVSSAHITSDQQAQMTVKKSPKTSSTGLRTLSGQQKSGIALTSTKGSISGPSTSSTSDQQVPTSVRTSAKIPSHDPEDSSSSSHHQEIFSVNKSNADKLASPNKNCHSPQKKPKSAKIHSPVGELSPSSNVSSPHEDFQAHQKSRNADSNVSSLVIDEYPSPVRKIKSSKAGSAAEKIPSATKTKSSKMVLVLEKLPSTVNKVKSSKALLPDEETSLPAHNSASTDSASPVGKSSSKATRTKSTDMTSDIEENCSSPKKARVDDSDDDFSISESVFKKPLPTVTARQSLLDFKALHKPPSHICVVSGKWSLDEEEKLLRCTVEIGEGNWVQIKEAMQTLRSSQQLKDKWRNLSESRKKAAMRTYQRI